MSDSEKQTITKINTEEKVKNPKRVAQGKKLAAISKAAKAAKAEQNQKKEMEEESFQLPSLSTSVSLVSITTAVIGTYIAWKNFKQEEVETKSPTPPPPPPKHPKVVYNDLDKDDI